MLDLMMPRTFQHIGKTNQIGLDVGVWINKGVSNTRLCGKMNHSLKGFFRKKCGHRPVIGHIHLDEAKIRVSGKSRQSGLFEIDVVIVVEIIDTDNLIPSRQQTEGGVHADESGSAGKQDFHPADFTLSAGGLDTHHARHREDHAEGTALAKLAFDVESRLMPGEDVLDDGEAQPRAAGSA